VVDSVASAWKAAAGIDSYLGGDGKVGFELWARRPAGRKIGKSEGYAERQRVRGRRRKDKRGETVRDGEPVESPLDEKQALAEASRCLQCDLRLTLCRNPSPPEKWVALNEENLAKVPQAEGVYILLDAKKETLKIAGVHDLRSALKAELGKGKAAFFHFEEDRMYTKKESELLQQYIQQHGKMPGGGGEGEDELF